MEITIEVLIERIKKIPTRNLKGDFRLKGNFEDWEFEDLEAYLQEEKPYIILNVNGDSLRIDIHSKDIFDGDGPTRLSKLYFLRPNPNSKLFLILHTKSSWPHWNETGEFIAHMYLEEP